jgi:hypothetical protein
VNCNCECLQNSIKQGNSEMIINAYVFLLFCEQEMLVFRKFKLSLKANVVMPSSTFRTTVVLSQPNVNNNTETSHIQVSKRS